MTKITSHITWSLKSLIRDIRISQHRTGNSISRCISSSEPPLIVAELSGNHNQSFERALAIIDAAADSGAHAIKLQTYTADTMTIDCDEPDFVIDDPGSLWHGEKLYQLYQKAHTPWEWHPALFERANQRGLLCFSTAFDESAVSFLESLDCPCYKIASFENSDLGLIEFAARTGKPLIISTGMASLNQLSETVETAQSAGCRDLVLLKCTSAYPASAADSHLRCIPDLRQRFQCHIGFSDHTMGIGVSVAATALGAVVIEKHLTLSRADGGVDAAFSLEPSELRMLVEESLRTKQALGEINYDLTKAEQSSLILRRSLYAVADIGQGEVLSERNVRVIRPGRGLAPKHLPQILGRKARAPIRRGSALSWSLIEDQDACPVPK